MKKYPCPSCGAEVTFQSSITIFTVCAYCRSTLVRKDLNLETLGKMAEIQDDSTPFQVGTTGRFKGEFVLLGRVRVSWQEGFWDEWYARYGDGSEAWLSEAQGFYMISFPFEKPDHLPAANEAKPEMTVQIGKTAYQIDDIKQITYSFADGELPFVAAQGFKGISVDLTHGENDFASIRYGKDGGPKDEVEVYVGQYLDFQEFHFQNLRQMDGW